MEKLKELELMLENVNLKISNLGYQAIQIKAALAAFKTQKEDLEAQIKNLN